MPAGRPRAFDTEKALDKALQVFWRKGYEGTSLPDLTKAMGINRPSLYSTFGNKEALFRKALARYEEGPAAFIREALQEPTARATAERLLYGTAELLTTPGSPPGCLIVGSALSCGKEADPIRKELIAHRAAAEGLIRKRFERAQSERDLPKSANAAELARFITTTIYGMAVQAAGGANKEELRGVVEAALRAWPK